MSQYAETPVPWGYIGQFLEEAKKKVESEIAAMPGAKLSGIEITLYPRRGTEGPTEEYNLTLGEVGERFVPDAQIVDAGEPKSSRLDNRKGTYTKTTSFDWLAVILALIAILRMIWLWLLQLLGIQKKDHSTQTPQDSPNLASDDNPIQIMLADIRDNLASQPEVQEFSVGVRALITASPTCASGTRCEWNWSRLGWYLRRYYPITTLTGGTTCGSSWTATRC